MRPADETPVAAATMKIVTRRVVPVVLALYVVAYMDRVSLSYAQLKMGADLGLDPAAFGLAASMFFVAYLLFEVPSNSILYRVGSRVWLARIGITWGIVTIATAFVQNESQLLIARLLLGAAEAGLVPGVMFYMTRFFPTAYKARAVGLFFLAGPLSGVIAGPIAGQVLDHVHWAGVASWRWVFVIFGVPAVIVGTVVAIVIRDNVKESTWLSKEQQDWLARTVELEHAATNELNGRGAHGGGSARKAVLNRRTLVLALFQFCSSSGAMGLVFFTPLIIQDLVASGVSAGTIGLLSALPFIAAAVTLLLVANSSDRRGERVFHAAVPVTVGAVALVALPLAAGSPALGIITLCVATMGAWAHAGPAYSLTQQQFVGRDAAIGIAVVSSGAAAAGLVAPFLFGLLTSATGSTAVGNFYLAGSLVLAGLLLVLSRKVWITVDTRQDLVVPTAAAEIESAREAT